MIWDFKGRRPHEILKIIESRLPYSLSFFQLEKFRQNFSKIKHRNYVRNMPRHKLRAVKLLIIAIEPV